MRRWLVLLLVSLALLQACDFVPYRARPRVYLFVASSMDEVTGAVTQAFRRTPEGVRLPIYQSSAGSQMLRLQIEGGAPADVLLSADADHVAALQAAGRVRDVRTFAYNGLVVIVPAANPAGIESFWDLPQAERIVIGTESVPIGRYTRLALARAAAARPASAGEAPFDQRVMARVASDEANVRLVRSKVELGEADAAIVYRTDAMGRPDLRAIPLPDQVQVVAEHQVALVVRTRTGPEPEVVVATAEAWVEFLLSEAGRSVLVDHGFEVVR